MKKMIIVGAGIAGLSAGCYGQMNGYETEIFEMHNVPGGLCAAWKRKGYTFDGCIHWLVGAAPGSRYYNSWNEIGALEGKEFIRYETVRQIEGDSGKKLVLYSDADMLEKHMMELSPSDGAVIKELTDAIRRFTLARNPSVPDENDKYKRISVEDFVQQFKDPFLREALIAFVGVNTSVYGLIAQLGMYHLKDAWWPIGGSLEFARGIEKRYLALGGRVQYNAKVDEIIVKDGRAVGVRLADGSVHNADFVVSATDGYEAVFHMLKGEYIDDEIKALYDNAQTFSTSVQISLGVDCDLSGHPHAVSVKLDSPVDIGGVETASFLFKHYCYDKTLCPPGKSVVTTLLFTGYEYWAELHRDPEAYRAEKQRVADMFIKVFEKRFPEAKGKIEVVDVATPVTYTRYTGAWKGAYMGWKAPRYKIPNTLPVLQNFYMTGQWTAMGGGLPVALMTGRGTIMRICKEDGKEFVSE